MYFLDNLKVRDGKLYTIGYSPVLNEYVMSVVITWIMWYDRHYRITKEEYDLAETNPEMLDKIAKRFLHTGCRGERFLCSEGPRENNEAQKELLNKLREHNASEELVRF